MATTLRRAENIMAMKQDLIRHIEAYAISKQTGDQLLMQWAAERMSAFLDGIEVAEPARSVECPVELLQETAGGDG